MATVDRILRQRDVHAMVALDTIDLITERMTNLLSHGRRITTVRRYTYIDQPPTVTAGQTVEGEPKVWKADDGTGFQVRLRPGINGFGFSCYGSDGNRTEKEAWARFHAGKSLSDSWSERRRDMTEVHIAGGLPGDGPARDDRIVIRHWNRDGVCDEVVVAFDYDTGVHDLAELRDELRDHVANLRDKQPWENRDMFERVLAALETHAATASGEEG